MKIEKLKTDLNIGHDRPCAGELTVRKRLADVQEMVRSGSPFLLTIVGEEEGASPSENDTRSAVDVAIIVQKETNDPPKFSHQRSPMLKLLKNNCRKLKN